MFGEIEAFVKPTKQKRLKTYNKKMKMQNVTVKNQKMLSIQGFIIVLQIIENTHSQFSAVLLLKFSS